MSCVQQLFYTLMLTLFVVCLSGVQNATIYFSDIADFVDISSDSEPMDIVTVLNSVYELIDSQIDAYDVYKVSTCTAPISFNPLTPTTAI